MAAATRLQSPRGRRCTERAAGAESRGALRPPRPAPDARERSTVPAWINPESHIKIIQKREGRGKDPSGTKGPPAPKPRVTRVKRAAPSPATLAVKVGFPRK